MHVAILGTGALGGVFAAYLSNAGHAVSCVDVRDEQVEAISENGLNVVDEQGQDVHAYPTATMDVREVDDVDVIFLFVKSYDTDTVLPDAEVIAGPGTRVVTLQNGLSNYERVKARFGASCAFGGTTTAGASLIEPGTVARTSVGQTVVGGDDVARAAEVAGIVDEAGFDAESVEDPVPYIWKKQLVNAGLKPVAALTELENGPMRKSGEAAEVMRRLVEETASVAEAQNIELLSEDPVRETYEICEANYGKRSSMLEDILNGRRTEIDYINGKVVALGAEVGVPTPYNDVVTKLVKAKEKGVRREPDQERG